MSEGEEDKVEQFVRRVEEETGHEIWVDEALGDDLGWFMVDTQLDLQGEEFDAEIDFNLSESDVSLLYAEITIDRSNEKQEAILDEEAERLDWGEDHALYEYYPNESELDELVDNLRKAHTEVYG